jgi:glycine hydroxymethyltransferase
LQAVIEALGLVLTNKYLEGLHGAKHYGGNKFIDQIMNLCKTKALKAFP